MATAARDRLARMLRGDVKSAFSVELTARPDELGLEVDGFGPVRLPVTPAKARKLIGLGLPARFGRGEETVTDPEVRDTWEIPKHLVHATWNAPMLKVILETIKEELGLPNGAVLTAGLHSLLVYEPNQFFLAHQDSEKDDAMVGTLVVTLPSSYAGGDLMVGHNEEWKAYRGSKTVLSLVAFYADCQHEVLKVQSGYRITLTYNLLLHGDTSRPDGEEGKLAELTALLKEHFATQAPRYLDGPLGEVPNRLVYLLDHEYTPRALNWARLKGADAARPSLLRTAAERSGYEAILALADLKTSHSAFPEHELRGYGRRWHDDYEDEDSDGGQGDDGEYEIQELIDSEVTLTHWTGPDGRRLEETSLSVSDAEVCASTENGDLTPYSQEYEGYMGNYGNTLDRWYHRAAVVVWPRSQAFANRAETSPGWALDEITTMATAGDVTGARDAATSLAPFWDGAVRALISAPAGNGPAAGLLGGALRTAAAVADAQPAASLLKPFRVESLTEAHAGPLAALAGHYGQRWTADLLRIWFGDGKPPWQYGVGAERARWVADRLPGLCQTLHAMGGDAEATAQLLLDLSWTWLGGEIDAALALGSPSFRNRQLDDLAKPLVAVLTSAATLGAAALSDTVAGHIRKQGDAVTRLELSALRAAASTPTKFGMAQPGGAGFADLAADCAPRLRSRLVLPQRAAGDWSISLPAGGCTCELCATLTTFLADPRRRTFEWPLAKERRQHIHGRIDKAEIPVTHLTRRQGSPFTLVLAKTDALFTGDHSARQAAQTDLEWLADCWDIPG